MNRTTQTLPAETGGTDITRFNALRHGVLSRYTVLPWRLRRDFELLTREDHRADAGTSGSASR